jgi:hypothetical protein
LSQVSRELSGIPLPSRRVAWWSPLCRLWRVIPLSWEGKCGGAPRCPILAATADCGGSGGSNRGRSPGLLLCSGSRFVGVTSVRPWLLAAVVRVVVRVPSQSPPLTPASVQIRSTTSAG